MKPALALLLAAAAPVCMTSCGPQTVDLSRHGHVSTFNVPYRGSPDRSGHATVSPYVGIEHPPGTLGGVYYHNGRRFSGGRYETGHFKDHGQYYSNRYHHDGRYYYGGSYQQNERHPKLRNVNDRS
ncbi:MAG: hypothetical protein V4662_08160 [Verrucomicrobiota bacterium]